jgi:hypothetical protein
MGLAHGGASGDRGSGGRGLVCLLECNSISEGDPVPGTMFLMPWELAPPQPRKRSIPVSEQK